MSCAYLHNVCIDNNLPVPEEEEENEEEEEEEEDNGDNAGLRVRDRVINHFFGNAD